MQTQIETLFPICGGWTCRWGRPSCRSEWFRAWRWQTAPLTQCAHGPLPRAPAAAHLTKEARGCAACASALATVLANDHTLAGFARCPQLVWFVKQKSLWVPRSSSGPQKAEMEMSAVSSLPGAQQKCYFHARLAGPCNQRAEALFPRLLSIPSAPEGHWHPLPGPPTFPTSNGVSELLVFELLTPCFVASPGELLPFKGLLSLGEVHLNNLASSEAPDHGSDTHFIHNPGIGQAVWGVILEVCLPQWHFL